MTTPFHLRTLLHDAVALPTLQAIVTATAPLDTDLAGAAEARFGAPVIEVFGSTETCVIAHRRTLHDEPWRLYSSIELHPQPDGTLVTVTSGVVLVDDYGRHRSVLVAGRRGDLRGRAGVVGRRARKEA